MFILKIFAAYLKFKFNWASCMLSDNSKFKDKKRCLKYFPLGWNYNSLYFRKTFSGLSLSQSYFIFFVLYQNIIFC